MKHSEQMTEIAVALAKAQAAIQNPTADANNPYFGSKYADLAGVLEAIRGPFSANGLSMVQSPETTWNDDRSRMFLTVPTMVLHSSGQWILDDGLTVEVVRRKGKRGQSADEEQVALNVPPTAQDLGSGITYLRRYGAAAMAGIAQADDDDDGNGASGRPPAPAAAARPSAGGAPVSAPAAKELPATASAEQLYAGCMALLSDVIRTEAGPVSSIDQNTRIAYKHEADEAKAVVDVAARQAALFKTYTELRAAVVAGRAAKTQGGAS
jgi:hypothetical protein